MIWRLGSTGSLVYIEEAAAEHSEAQYGWATQAKWARQRE